MKDWQAWVANHQNPKAAKRVLDWLEKGDFDELVWQACDQLVELINGRSPPVHRNPPPPKVWPSERKMQALRLRVTPMSYDEAGKIMGITAGRVNQLAIAALHSLKHPSRREKHPDWWMVAKFYELRGKRGL